MDAMNVLSTIMQDPEAMKKAMSIASMLSSSGALEGIISQNQQGGQKQEDVTDAQSFAPLIRDASEEQTEPAPSAPSPLSNGNQRVSMEQRLALLAAIRPYLSRDKAAKLDSVIGILKLVSTLEKSGIKLF